jgi:hypothetical protein
MKKHLLAAVPALALLVLAPAPAAAQPQAQPSRAAPAAPQPRQISASFAPGARAIPFELFRGTRIFFQGTINGRPASMMLDSGAGSTVISKRYADAIRLAGTRPMMVRGVGGTEQASLAQNVAVSAGALTVNGVSAIIIDIAETEAQIGRPIDVILGMEAFRAGIVDVDFSARMIRFAPAQGFVPPVGAVVVPISQGSTRRTIPISVNGGPPIEADLDIGNGGALLLSHAAWQGQREIAAIPSVMSSAGGVGGRIAKRLVTLPTVSVAGQTFRNVPSLLNVGANDLPETGANVGIELLRRFRLLFHYDRSTLYLVPDPAAIARPLQKNRHGMRLRLAGDRLSIDEVMAGSPAAAASLQVGQEIVAVNGRAVDERFWFRDDAQFGDLPAGTRIALTRADGIVVSLTLRDFF